MYGKKSIILLALIFIVLLILTKIFPNPLFRNSKFKIVPTPSLSPINSPTTTPTITISVKTPVNSPTPSIFTSPKNEISDFVYPNSKINSQNNDSLNLESSDSPQTITDWYKNKIQGLGMSAKSFIQTNTNGNVLNKLVASNGRQETSVEITKSSGQNSVIISVKLSF